jgi:hypothetical protein
LSDKKQTTQGTTSNTASYDYKTPPTTPALDTLKNQTFEIDPGIAAQYGRERNDLNRSFQNPTGAFLSPQVRDMQLESGRERLGSQEAQAMREGAYDVNKLNFARNQAVAGMSAPQLVQTGSTGTQQGTTIQSESPWKTALQVGASAAPISL